MPLTPQEFAAQLVPLRGVLLHAAARNCPCSLDDAEDLVADTICQALALLPGFEASDERALYIWLKSILGVFILRSRREQSRRVETVEMAQAAQVAAPPPSLSPREQLQEDMERLPRSQRVLMEDWLDGYTQADIARAYGLHRHTIATRLLLAAETLRMRLPDDEDLTYNRTARWWLKDASVYHRQNSMARRWNAHHPPDKRLS